jgi:hypothetical protein
MPIIDLKQWLRERGIEFEHAKKLAEQLKIAYPHLYLVLQQNQDVLGQLEAMALIHDIQQKKFPPEVEFHMKVETKLLDASV